MIERWCLETSGVKENLFVHRLRQVLTEAEVKQVIEIVLTTCPNCYNSTRFCDCENDE